MREVVEVSIRGGGGGGGGAPPEGGEEGGGEGGGREPGDGDPPLFRVAR